MKFSCFLGRKTFKQDTYKNGNMYINQMRKFWH